MKEEEIPAGHGAPDGGIWDLADQVDLTAYVRAFAERADRNYLPPLAEAQSSCHRWIVEEATDAAITPDEPIRLAVGDGRYTVPIDLKDRPWPVPIAGQAEHVLLVVREWVEEDASKKLISLIISLPAWDAVVRRARSWRHVQKALGVQPMASAYQWFLSSYGLPATPGMARFLLHTVDPEAYPRACPGIDPVPTRGIRVTSIGLWPSCPASFAHGHMAHTLTCLGPGITARLSERADRVARDHAEWWCAISNRFQIPTLRLDCRARNGRGPDAITALIDLHRAGEFDRDTLAAKVAAWEECCSEDELAPHEITIARGKVRQRLYRQRRLRRSP